MKVLVASPYPERLLIGLHGHNDEIIYTTEPPATWPDADWVISYGYRYLIGLPTIEKYGGQIINIHISMLPYNRGADPNFWSWFDDTPKGITIHTVDQGLDTGPILSQTEAYLRAANHTLASSYDNLQMIAQLHFGVVWPSIRAGEIEPRKQPKVGTYPRSVDKDIYMNRLPLGWDTPVRDVEALGRAIRDAQASESVSGR